MSIKNQDISCISIKNQDDEFLLDHVENRNHLSHNNPIAVYLVICKPTIDR
jgi:hypothetical protein